MDQQDELFERLFASPDGERVMRELVDYYVWRTNGDADAALVRHGFEGDALMIARDAQRLLIATVRRAANHDGQLQAY